MLQLERISKRGPAHLALHDVTLQVAGGECVGLVCEDRLAAARVVRLAATLIRPDSGTVVIDGINAMTQPFSARRLVSYVGGPAEAPPGVRVGDYLATVTAGRQSTESRSRITEALARARLNGATELSALSLADRQRLAITAALQAGPRLIVFDADLPLDERARVFVFESLGAARDSGVAVFVASDRASTFEPICSRTIHMAAGRVAMHASVTRHLAASTAGLLS